MPHSPPESNNLARERITTLVGKCLLNFQLYELRLKKLLPLIEQSITDSSESVSNVANATLGSLATAFRTKAFSYEGQSRAEEPSRPGNGTEEGRMTIKFSHVFLTEGDYNSRLASLAELVEERNHLVHHFLEAYDLDDDKSCSEAEQHLERLLKLTNQWLADLTRFASNMMQAREKMARELADPNVSCRLFAEPPSDSSEWQALNEVKALKDAETLAAPDGYTELEQAIDHLEASGIARDAFRQIGLGSWQQLVFESGCFDLTKRKDEATGRWIRRYRSKPE